MDWMDILASESTEKEEMSMLAARFATRMQKRVADSKDESTLISNGKRPRRSSPDEEAQKDWVIIPVDSPDRATNYQTILEGAPSGVCDAPKLGCPLTTRQPTKYSWMSGNLPDIHENRAESPLYGELYPNKKPVSNSSQ